MRGLGAGREAARLTALMEFLSEQHHEWIGGVERDGLYFAGREGDDLADLHVFETFQ